MCSLKPPFPFLLQECPFFLCLLPDSVYPSLPSAFSDSSGQEVAASFAFSLYVLGACVKTLITLEETYVSGF